MPRIDCLKTTPIKRTPRVMQLEGMFDVPRAATSEVRITAKIPFEQRDWQIGLIVGPSGSGKTTIARELFGDVVDVRFEWPSDASLVDAFPAEMSIREITLLLSSVGFSSPPSWLRPFRVLSNGEQFRATIARALAEQRELVVIDEFTSVVDRGVARIGSAAIAKAVRRNRGCDKSGGGGDEKSLPRRRFVAVSCHYDIIDWLCPDWLYEPDSETFHWRSERRRPPISLEITRVPQSAWKLFRQHHYLSRTLSPLSQCFVASVDGQPAAFTAVLSFPHPLRSGWREHRTVCLPDFQGVGIGNALSEFVAGLFKAKGKPYRSTTSSPAMIQHRARSPLWQMTRKPSMVKNSRHSGLLGKKFLSSHGRITASFEYVGPAAEHDALKV